MADNDTKSAQHAPRTSKAAKAKEERDRRTLEGIKVPGVRIMDEAESEPGDTPAESGGTTAESGEGSDKPAANE